MEQDSPGWQGVRAPFELMAGTAFCPAPPAAKGTAFSLSNRSNCLSGACVRVSSAR